MKPRQPDRRQQRDGLDELFRADANLRDVDALIPREKPEAVKRAQLRTFAWVLTAAMLVGLGLGSMSSWGQWSVWGDLPGSQGGDTVCVAPPSRPGLTMVLDSTIPADSAPVLDSVQTWNTTSNPSPWGPGNVRVTDTLQRVAVVFSARSVVPTAVSVGAKAMTQYVAVGTQERVRLYLLSNPDTGTQALSLTMGTTGERAAATAYVLSGVDSVAPADTARGASATSFALPMDSVALTILGATMFSASGGTFNPVVGATTDLDLLSGSFLTFGGWHGWGLDTATVSWATNRAYAGLGVSFLGTGYPVGQVTYLDMTGTAYASICAAPPGHASSSWWVTDPAGDTIWQSMADTDSLTSWNGAALDSISDTLSFVVGHLTYTDANGTSAEVADTIPVLAPSVVTPTVTAAVLPGDSTLQLLGSPFTSIGGLTHDSSTWTVTQAYGSSSVVFTTTDPDSLEAYTGAGPVVPDSLYEVSLIYYGGGLASGVAVDTILAVQAWLVEDFSTYADFADWYADPRGIWAAFGSDSVNVKAYASFVSPGYGTSGNALRYTYPDRTGSGARCTDFEIRANLDYPAAVAAPGEVWIEWASRFDSTWTTAAPAGWGCVSNTDFKNYMGRTLPDSRFDLKAGTFNAFWDATYPGLGHGGTGLFGGSLNRDYAWHVYRVYQKLSTDRFTADGAMSVWIDGVLVKQFTGVAMTTVAGTGDITSMYGAGFWGNLNQGPDHAMTYDLGYVRLYNTDPGW